MRLLILLLAVNSCFGIEVAYFATAGHGDAGSVPSVSNFTIALPAASQWRGYSSPLNAGADWFLTNFNLPQFANITSLTFHVTGTAFNLIGDRCSAGNFCPCCVTPGIQLAIGQGIINNGIIGFTGPNLVVYTTPLFSSTAPGQQNISFSQTFNSGDVFLTSGNVSQMEVASGTLMVDRNDIIVGAPPPCQASSGLNQMQYECVSLTSWFTVALTMAISCGPTTTGSVGVPFSDTFPVTGGTGPFTFAIIAGSLPLGTSLNASTGVISGTPTAPATYSFTIQVTDSSSPTNLIDTVACAITISGTAPPLSGVLENYIMSDNPNFLELTNFIHSN